MTIQILNTRSAKLNAVDDTERVIEGICSSGRKDNQGEILEPEGATWKTPLPLLSDHSHDLQIGEVQEIWRDGDKVRFRASVTSADLYSRITSRQKVGVSVGFEPKSNEVAADGTRHITDWRIAEVSIVGFPCNPDGRVETARSRRSQKAAPRSAPTAPAKKTPVVHYDPAPEPGKDSAKSGVDKQSDIQSRLDDIQREIDRAERRLYSDGIPYHEADALTAEVKELKTEFESLYRRKFAIESGRPDPGEEQPKAARSKATGRDRDLWEIKRGLPEPEYPKGARKAGEHDRLKAAIGAFEEFHLAEMYMTGEKMGSPDDPATLDLVMLLAGVLKAHQKWTGHRMEEAEERIAELEARSQHFAGVHQRALSYRKGALVTYAGALWAAVVDVPEGATPGSSDHWQLAVKRGDLNG
ncbi:HK97 family phage prohead protease [Pseudohoeflea suaedae]|nr:HK97 family phage prohead protease [Pseudohoeflea suaedae]